MRRIERLISARALLFAAPALLLFWLSGPTAADAPPQPDRPPLDRLDEPASAGPTPEALAAAPPFVPPVTRPAPAALEPAPALDPLAHRRFAREIRAAAARQGVDPLLIAAVVEVESNFAPDAVSPRGAVGLMQLMPVHFGGAGAPSDPAANLEFGARYLRELERRFGSLPVALAAYHAGPGAVERAGGAAPYRSTRAYVARVLSAYERYRLAARPASAELGLETTTAAL